MKAGGGSGTPEVTYIADRDGRVSAFSACFPAPSGVLPYHFPITMSDSSSASGTKKAGTSSSPSPNFTAFTLRSEGVVRRISFNVGITAAIAGDTGVPKARLAQYTAVLDTAAERTRVSRKVIEVAGLEPDSGSGTALRYLADIYLPNMIRFTEVPVTQMPAELEAQADCLVGMDILSCADCCLSHQDRRMMFSFRVPPLGVIDFVKEHQRLHKGTRKMVTTSATRNQLCPCGSGKRFKNCCGKIY